jgi:hypothetical protein
MKRLIEAVAVTAELTGTTLSRAASRALVQDLAHYPEADVLMALKRCRRELRGKLSLAEILDRLPNDRPGVEEAWAMIRQVMNNEQASLVWTDEMREAYGVAAPLADDLVAARMAFREKYAALVAEARTARRPVHWSVSFGFDPTLRREAIEEAARRNRLSHDAAAQYRARLGVSDAGATTRGGMTPIGEIMHAVQPGHSEA